MDAWIESVMHWAAQLGPLGAYALTVGLLLLGGFGCPLPEDIPLLLAGVLAHGEGVSLTLMIVLSFTAVFGADSTLFLLGRHYGHHVPRLPLVRRYLTEKRLASAEAAFQKHGGKTLFFSRFVVGLRAAVFFSAGYLKIPYWKLVVFDGSAALISVPTLVLLGWFFADNFEYIKRAAKLGEAGAVVLVVLLAGGFVAYKLWRRRQAKPVGAVQE